MPFGLRAPHTFQLIWLSNLSPLVVPDDGYSRNVSCALKLISTFLFQYLDLLDFKNSQLRNVNVGSEVNDSE